MCTLVHGIIIHIAWSVLLCNGIRGCLGWFWLLVCAASFEAFAMLSVLPMAPTWCHSVGICIFIFPTRHVRRLRMTSVSPGQAQRAYPACSRKCQSSPRTFANSSLLHFLGQTHHSSSAMCVWFCRYVSSFKHLTAPSWPPSFFLFHIGFKLW